MFLRNKANSRIMIDYSANASSNLNEKNEEKWTMKKSTLFGFAWNMLCASVCMYQLYHVSDVYFKYPTAVNIEHPLRTHTEVPGITIRIQNGYFKQYLWRRSILKQKYPQLFEAYENDFKKLGKNATEDERWMLHSNSNLTKKLNS